MDESIMQPIIQYGFAGMCGILLGILVWLISKLLAILEKTNSVIAANTEAIKIVEGHTSETITLLKDLRDRILQLKCVKDK
ncbi:MAG: hypothetical protein A2Y07_01245 [Planctomycetes bacterium GWF2_50_10]|nr:MAG: hypothetical protein A2Y07_01245 [Planctomycetes bacterium GWF2_50_10]